MCKDIVQKYIAGFMSKKNHPLNSDQSLTGKCVKSIHQNSPSFEKTSPRFLRSCSGINDHSCDLQGQYYFKLQY